MPDTSEEVSALAETKQHDGPGRTTSRQEQVTPFSSGSGRFGSIPETPLIPLKPDVRPLLIRRLSGLVGQLALPVKGC